MEQTRLQLFAWTPKQTTNKYINSIKVKFILKGKKLKTTSDSRMSQGL